MSVVIDLSEPDVPKHQQLANYIRARIDDGTYPPRGRIPSEAHWVGETGFARETVRKAMALLIDEGRIYIVRGMGTFVSPLPHQRALQLRQLHCGQASPTGARSQEAPEPRGLFRGR